MLLNKPSSLVNTPSRQVVDVPTDEVTSTVKAVDDKQAAYRTFCQQTRGLEPRARLAAITEAYLTDKITAGSMSAELVDMFPFNDRERSQFEARLREKYGDLHPSLSAFE